MFTDLICPYRFTDFSCDSVLTRAVVGIGAADEPYAFAVYLSVTEAEVAQRKSISFTVVVGKITHLLLGLVA